MKIEDLIVLLNNRLREFQLSRDYARMSGDLERMNTAEKEVLILEDTLFKLNLLIDTSKSAAVKEEILAEVITDGSVAVLDEYDISPYATDPEHEEKIMNILSKMGIMDTVEKIDKYIKNKSLGSPVTGEMVMSASLAYAVDVRLIMAIMEQDSHFGTFGVAVRTLNPGNVGNDDGGNTRTYDSWQEGVTAVAEWLSKHRGSTIMSETFEETVIEYMPTSTSLELNEASSTSNGAGTATSTSSIIMPTAISTPTITTSTTTTITNLPTISTTTPTITSTTTPTTATSTPTTTSTTTPVTATSTPETATTTPAETSTTSAEETATSTPGTTETETATTTTSN